MQLTHQFGTFLNFHFVCEMSVGNRKHNSFAKTWQNVVLQIKKKSYCFFFFFKFNVVAANIVN